MRKQKFLAALLAVVMLFTLVPVMSVSADETDSAGDAETTINVDSEGYIVTTALQDDMTLRKKATLEDDGTYTIDLEAWATGDPVYATIRNGLPSDIVLVLDQSGSMAQDDNGSYAGVESGTLRYQALQSALEEFIKLIQQNSLDYNVDHRVSMVGFASNYNIGASDSNPGVSISANSSPQYWINTGIFIDGYLKNYGSNSNASQLTEENYMDSLEYPLDGDTIEDKDAIDNTTIAAAIDRIGRSGGTYTEYGLLMAQGVFDAIEAQDTTDGEGNAVYADDGAWYFDETTNTWKERQKIVVVFTDGETNSDEDTILEYAETLKDDNVIVYSVSLLNTTNALLDLMSSNYRDITDYDSCFDKTETSYTETNRVRPDSDTVYYVLDDGVYYEVTITRSSTGGHKPTYTYTYTDAEGTAHTVTPKTDNDSSGAQFYTKDTTTGTTISTSVSGDPDKHVDTKYYSNAVDTSALDTIFKNFSTEITAPGTDAEMDDTTELKDIVSSDFDVSNAEVTVQYQEGFWNADNTAIQWENNTSDANDVSFVWSGNTLTVTGFDYCENHIGKNSANGAADGHAGKKIIVKITGIIAKDSAVTGSPVDTNGVDSGIYYTDPETNYVYSIAFGVPTTVLTTKTFVIDYAKTAALDMSGVQNAAKGIDSASDLELNKIGSTANITAAYGNVAYANGVITYTPKTTNWNGYDSFYVLGDTTDGTALDGTANDVHDNVWTKVSVIPANNIYYEDTFETDGADTVGIEYTGSWTKDTDASTSNTSESVNTETHGGWQNANLADDAGYSDGTAHTVNVSDGSQATATFKFTGTGFDVYSRTNNLTGTVAVIVRDESDNYVKGFSIDTVSRSGEYDGVPTLSVLDLEHGTYNVTIYVTSAADTAESGNRATYYIDGIRIYNPLGTDNPDTTVSTAYGDEINASFKEVRDILLDAGSFGTDAGVVFIDQADPADTSSSGNYEIGTYETYGPENEVYLAAGQSIVFRVASTEVAYHIGFRSPTGENVTVEYSVGADSKESKTINHTTDLYYKVTPNTDGTITITNTSGALLSVTKIRTSGAAASQGLMLLSMTEDEALDTVAAFSLMRVVDTKEEPVDPETPSTDPDDSQDTTEEPEEPEIDIVNPEPENKPEIEEVKNELNKLVTNLFKNIFKWFGRR